MKVIRASDGDKIKINSLGKITTSLRPGTVISKSTVSWAQFHLINKQENIIQKIFTKLYHLTYLKLITEEKLLDLIKRVIIFENEILNESKDPEDYYSKLVTRIYNFIQTEKD